jgi:pantoate--beta-alanine ligase
MKVLTTVKEVREHYRVSVLRNPGFVPTMGALHEGHISLVDKAVESCRMAAVSIFVNPTQFNDPNDLLRYPRTLEADLQMLSGHLRENDFVFIPSVEEVYPEPDTRRFDFGELERVMEGVHRPGHFNGVAQVVSRLFDIIQALLCFLRAEGFSAAYNYQGTGQA